MENLWNLEFVLDTLLFYLTSQKMNSPEEKLSRARMHVYVCVCQGSTIIIKSPYVIT